MREALACYAIDVSYAVAMCERAVTIQAKQATWASRKRVRDAEAAARARCEAAPTFTCEATAPCGTTTACRWSTGELRDLDVPVVPPGSVRGGRPVTRPQPGPGGKPTTYNLEAAVAVLRDHLEGSTQPA